LKPFPAWLGRGKKAAVCFTIDDVHPGKSSDAYEAGGDLGRGALRHLEWLLERHPQLRVTLFVTADWREINPYPTRRALAGIPWLRDRVYLTRVLPRGTMRLGRHPEFVAYLRSLPRTDCALHGLYHINRGRSIAEEYKGRGRAECERMLRRVVSIFHEAGLPYSPGMCPPAWGLSDDLAQAMIAVGLRFVASGRDIRTEITADAVNAMSGRPGVSLIYPERIMADGGGCQSGLLHFCTNFQATSPLERAHQIIALNGLVAVKAHIVKDDGFGHQFLDGLDESYRDYMHRVFAELEDRYGEELWWTSVAEITTKLPITNSIGFHGPDCQSP
jgi:hypothetical protein